MGSLAPWEQAPWDTALAHLLGDAARAGEGISWDPDHAPSRRRSAADTGSRRTVVERDMPRRIHLAPHLTNDELQDRYRRAHDPVERSHWHFLCLLAGGMTATAGSASTGYSAY